MNATRRELAVIIRCAGSRGKKGGICSELGRGYWLVADGRKVGLVIEPTELSLRTSYGDTPTFISVVREDMPNTLDTPTRALRPCPDHWARSGQVGLISMPDGRALLDAARKKWRPGRPVVFPWHPHGPSSVE